jgi:hypothetical protein
MLVGGTTYAGIRQPDIIGPAVGTHGDQVAALVIRARAIDQHATHAGGARSPKVISHSRPRRYRTWPRSAAFLAFAHRRVLFDGTALVAVHDHVFRYEVSPHFGDGRALSKYPARFDVAFLLRIARPGFNIDGDSSVFGRKLDRFPRRRLNADILIDLNRQIVVIEFDRAVVSYLSHRAFQS